MLRKIQASVVSSRLYFLLRYRPPFCWASFVLLLLTGKIRNVPVASLTNLGAFSFSQDGWHPYTAVLKQIDGDPELRSQDSILREFYNRFVPESRNGFLPIHSKHSWQSTKECYVSPWRGVRSSILANSSSTGLVQNPMSLQIYYSTGLRRFATR
jgi:hypothetical protein